MDLEAKPVTVVDMCGPHQLAFKTAHDYRRFLHSPSDMWLAFSLITAIAYWPEWVGQAEALRDKHSCLQKLLELASCVGPGGGDWLWNDPVRRKYFEVNLDRAMLAIAQH